MLIVQILLTITYALALWRSATSEGAVKSPGRLVISVSLALILAGICAYAAWITTDPLF